MHNLMRAAQKGKEVTVVLELMAFHLVVNIAWAAKLEDVGVYRRSRVFGYKTHAKFWMLVRREGRPPAAAMWPSFGTGNYHPGTIRVLYNGPRSGQRTKRWVPTLPIFKQPTGLGTASTCPRFVGPSTLQPNGQGGFRQRRRSRPPAGRPASWRR